MGKPFPNIPSSPIAAILPYIVGFLVLFLDSTSRGGATNPFVFFFVVTAMAIFFMYQQGFENIVEGFSLNGNIVTIIALILGGIGVGMMVFFGVAKPASILFSSLGYNTIAQSFFPLYNPFSTFDVSQLNLLSLTGANAIFFVFIYFILVAFGETGLIVYSWKNWSNFFSEHTNWNDSTISFTARSISLIFWALLHVFAVGAGSLILFSIVAIAIGMVFFIGYFFIGEPMEFPSTAIDWLTYVAWFEIAMHAIYDIMIGLQSFNLLPSLFAGISISFMFIGMAAIIFFVKKRGLL